MDIYSLSYFPQWQIHQDYIINHRDLGMSNNSYSDQQLTTLLSALRANRICKNERKNFNTIRATVSGQVEPSIAKNSALTLIDCYHRVNSVPTIAGQRKSALECLKGGQNCETQINAYINAD